MKQRHDMVQCYVARPAGGGWAFLQLHRVPDDYMGNTWQTVSGRSEAGESAWEAALRELKEEAGLDPAELFRLDGINSFYTEADDTLWHSIRFCVLVGADARVELDAEHDGHRWVSADQAEASFMWPGDRDAIGQIRREILATGGLARAYMRIDIVRENGGWRLARRGIMG